MPTRCRSPRRPSNAPFFRLPACRSSRGDSHMEPLTSPKITVGVHCLKLRTKSMYINAVVDPAERTFYDRYDQPAGWSGLTQTGLGPDRQPVNPDACCDGRGCCDL